MSRDFARIRRLLGRVSGLAACTLMLLPSAVAAPSTGNGVGKDSGFVEVPTRPVDIKVGKDGKSFWELRVTSSLGYVASWDRKKGLWESTEAALADVKKYSSCTNNAVLKYLNRFPSYSAYEADKGHKQGLEGIEFTDPAVKKAYQACAAVSQVGSDQVSSEESGGKYTRVIRIPITLIGPGTHRLFAARYDMDTRDTAHCPKKYWKATATEPAQMVSGNCNPHMTHEQTFTVVVPEPLSKAVLVGPIAESGHWLQQSKFSQLASFDVAGVSDAPRSSGEILWRPVLYGVIAAVVMALLLSLLLRVTQPGRERPAEPEQVDGGETP